MTGARNSIQLKFGHTWIHHFQGICIQKANMNLAPIQNHTFSNTAKRWQSWCNVRAGHVVDGGDCFSKTIEECDERDVVFVSEFIGARCGNDKDGERALTGG